MAATIADAAQRVLDLHGEDEYLRKWVDAPFPTDHLQLIRGLLATAN
jgi:hypothetical protein